VRVDRYRDDNLEREWVVTTIGRLIFHDAIDRRLREVIEVYDSADHEFMNSTLDKKRITRYVVALINQWGTSVVASLLDTIKHLGFEYASRAGATVAKNDIVIPPRKGEIIASYDEKTKLIRKQYDRGLITEQERKERVIDLWTSATEEVGNAMVDNLDTLNPIYMMANSGARGSFKQISQLAGMRGLMSNPKGEIIDEPIRANFMEGLSVLEFFISTHGARKGLADTALRTADSGYLTRRLVDVAQDVIVRTEDCNTKNFVTLPLQVSEGGDINEMALGRVLRAAVWQGRRGAGRRGRGAH